MNAGQEVPGPFSDPALEAFCRWFRDTIEENPQWREPINDNLKEVIKEISPCSESSDEGAGLEWKYLTDTNRYNIHSCFDGTEWDLTPEIQQDLLQGQMGEHHGESPELAGRDRRSDGDTKA